MHDDGETVGRGARRDRPTDPGTPTGPGDDHDVRCVSHPIPLAQIHIDSTERQGSLDQRVPGA